MLKSVSNFEHRTNIQNRTCTLFFVIVPFVVRSCLFFVDSTRTMHLCFSLSVQDVNTNERRKKSIETSISKWVDVKY